MNPSPITNCWGRVTPVSLNVKHFTIYRSVPGAAYSHQAQLTSLDGRLYATWSLGIRDEEDPGERMVCATSDDAGETWSEPRTIAAPYRGEAAMSVVVSSGIVVHEGKLIAFNGEWERTAAGCTADGRRNEVNDISAKSHCHTCARVSADRGATWSAPVEVSPRLAGYMTPGRTATGRLILPGHLTFPYTDDLTNWQWAGLPGLDAEFVDIYDNMHAGNKRAGTGQLYNEASFFQTDDGVLHMMLRNETEAYRLGVTESRDNGVTWSPPMLTDYTDNVCRAHFGRLPDGRYFGMSCPHPAERHQRRTPAILALSKDGVTFDRHYIIGDEPEPSPRIPGLYKHGRYGYPYLHVMGEHGFVIYSVVKEDIAVGRFALGDLQ
ncbi:MAG: hypothetical protein PCFJNLEI_02175 [Verrucomicrobiae bacterium]|nr:hypothetical protein [Verrucomicrobiae bacterium]